MKGKSLKYGSFILIYSDTFNSMFVGYIQLYFIDIYSLYLVIVFLWIISFKHIINFDPIYSSSPLLKFLPLHTTLLPSTSLPFIFMPNMFIQICTCDMRACTEFYACINIRTTNKKKYNVCLPVLDFCHPHLHTFPQQTNSFFHSRK